MGLSVGRARIDESARADWRATVAGHKQVGPKGAGLIVAEGRMQAQRLYPGFPPPPPPSSSSNARYSPGPNYAVRSAAVRHCISNPTGNLFGSLDSEAIFQQARAEAALMEMKGPRPGDMFAPYHSSALHHVQQQQSELEQMGGGAGGGLQHPYGVMEPQHQAGSMMHSMAGMQYQPHSYSHHTPFPPMGPPGGGPCPSRYAVAALPMSAGGGAGEAETDPRELERFAEHFKQRRIKLGVTQADVGKALAHLKMPGVGSLSQSTICRFESLTLSHNNMVALKPILHSWLEKAEEASKGKDPNGGGILPNAEKKRKRTSIAAPEKRSLEAYFAIQPRPSGEKIAAIAEKLDLKKNVVRVWFCNQRQKQKRWRYSAGCSKDGGIKQELL